MASLSTPNWALFLSILLTACVFDVIKRRVPNWLTIGALCAGLGARVMDAGFQAAGWGLLGSLTGLALLFFPFHRRWVGAGDVKLLGSLGAWLGPLATLEAALVGAALGGLLSLLFILRAPGPERQNILTNLKLTFYLRTIAAVEPRSQHSSPPYAVALSGGAAAAVIFNGVHFGLA